MDLVNAIILGIVQGLTEFLPVSSSGHLVMTQTLLGVTPGGGIVFEVAVHLATLVAIVIYYFKRIMALVVGAFTGQAEAWRDVGKLALATLPAIVVALLARDLIEEQFNSPYMVGCLLLATGCIVWTTRYTITKGSNLKPSWRDAFIIGCAQAFAILPGISRSGTTVAVAMALGMSPLAAAEFSFLMGVIAMAGAAVLLLPELTSASPELITSILAGGAAALVFGLLALIAFVWLLKSQRFYVFAWYAWAAGGSFLLWLTLGNG